jgi:hypothetical protein
MNGVAPLVFLAFVALAFAMRSDTGPVIRRRKAPANAVVPFDVITQDGSDTVEQNLLELSQAASQKVGRTIPPDVFALGAMIASEEGGGTQRTKAAVAWTARNMAARRKKSLVDLLAPGGILASQSLGGRYAATDDPPTLTDLAIAERVMNGTLPDETKGAVQFDSPNAQRALLARKHPRYKSTPEQVAADRTKEKKTLVTLPGISQDRLRFWRPESVVPPTPAGVSGLEPTFAARRLRDMGAHEAAYMALVEGRPHWNHDDIVTFLSWSPSTLDTEEGEDFAEGVVGHDETYDESVAGRVSKQKIPTGPVPKLVEALAEKWGKIWGVPKSFIQTIASIESSFVPAKSNTSERAIKLGGAWGLMQVTYASAQDLVRQAKASPQAKEWTEIKRILRKKWHDDGPDLLDPELNVMLGSYFLSRLFREFRDIDKVAAGYHAGAGGVRSALREGGDKWKRLLGPYSRTYISMAETAFPKFA